MIRVVGFIGEQVTSARQSRTQHNGPLDIGCLTRRQKKNEWATMFITYGVNLGVSSAFGATYGLNRSPPFPPPAQR